MEMINDLSCFFFQGVVSNHKVQMYPSTLSLLGTLYIRHQQNGLKTSLHRAVNLVSPAHLDLTLWAESGGTQTDKLSVLGMLLWTNSLKACVLSVFLWFQHVEARYIAARIHLMNAFLNKKSRWKTKRSPLRGHWGSVPELSILIWLVSPSYLHIFFPKLGADMSVNLKTLWNPLLKQNSKCTIHS